MDNNILLKIKYIILKHIETSQQDNIICVAPQAKNIEFEKKKNTRNSRINIKSLGKQHVENKG